MSDDEKERGCCSSKWGSIMWMVIVFSLAMCTAVTEVARNDGFRTEAIEETS